MKVSARELLLASILAVAAAILMAQVPDIVMPQDKGPAEIDVRKLSKEMQQAYRLTLQKCSLCHTAARVFNTSMPADYWARYLGNMIRKYNAPIADAEAETISEFLIFDHVNRKDATPRAFYRPLTEDEIEKIRASQKIKQAPSNAPVQR